MHAQRVNWYSAVPTIHQILLARADEDAAPQQSGFRFIRSCSAALAPATLSQLEERFGAPVLEAYGTTFNRWVHEERDVRQAGLPERAIAALTATGHTYEQDGALWFRSTDFGDDKDRVLRKSDGELTYFAVDIGFRLGRLSSHIQP